MTEEKAKNVKETLEDCNLLMQLLGQQDNCTVDERLEPLVKTYKAYLESCWSDVCDRVRSIAVFNFLEQHFSNPPLRVHSFELPSSPFFTNLLIRRGQYVWGQHVWGACFLPEIIWQWIGEKLSFRQILRCIFYDPDVEKACAVKTSETRCMIVGIMKAALKKNRLNVVRMMFKQFGTEIGQTNCHLPSCEYPNSCLCYQLTSICSASFLKLFFMHGQQHFVGRHLHYLALNRTNLQWIVPFPAAFLSEESKTEMQSAIPKAVLEARNDVFLRFVRCLPPKGISFDAQIARAIDYCNVEFLCKILHHTSCTTALQESYRRGEKNWILDCGLPRLGRQPFVPKNERRILQMLGYLHDNQWQNVQVKNVYSIPIATFLHEKMKISFHIYWQFLVDPLPLPSQTSQEDECQDIEEEEEETNEDTEWQVIIHPDQQTEQKDPEEQQFPPFLAWCMNNIPNDINWHALMDSVFRYSRFSQDDLKKDEANMTQLVSILEAFLGMYPQKEPEVMKCILSACIVGRSVLHTKDNALLHRIAKTFPKLFNKIETLDFKYYGCSLEVLQFLREIYFPNAFPNVDPILRLRPARALFCTLDVKVHDYAWDNKIYDHEMIEWEVDSIGYRDFNVWKYAFEHRDVPLLTWLCDKKFKQPTYHVAPLSLTTIPLNSAFLHCLWARFYEQNPTWLLYLTLFPHASHLVLLGDWAFQLYAKVKCCDAQEVQNARARYSDTYLPICKTLPDWKCSVLFDLTDF